MKLGRIGNPLLAIGMAIVAVGYLLIALAIPSGTFVTGIGVLAVALGSGALALEPRPPLTGGIARAGLGILAVGATCLEVAALIAAGMTFDPFESMPVVVFGFIGLTLTPIGLVVTLLALVRRLVSRS